MISEDMSTRHQLGRMRECCGWYTFPTAPSPVTTHCSLAISLEMFSIWSDVAHTFSDCVAGVAIVYVESQWTYMKIDNDVAQAQSMREPGRGRMSPGIASTPQALGGWSARGSDSRSSTANLVYSSSSPRFHPDCAIVCTLLNLCIWSASALRFSIVVGSGLGGPERCGVKASTSGGVASRIGLSVGANEGPAGAR